MRVKIFGAGSIGNHLAHAARALGWDVTVCDVDPAALTRMKERIYPSRYGAWDPAIRQCTSATAPAGGFDLIAVGTPPDVHVPVALEALRERPRAILVEKPVCPPSLHLADELLEAARASSTAVFVGYDHAVGRAARRAEDLITAGAIGPVRTIDVEFREHWAGIFAAHPWLAGPDDSYLGHWSRGGGASGEHSHAANLWQHFAHVAGGGRVTEVDAMLTYVAEGRGVYDELCAMTVRTEGGLSGRIVQDVVTRPPRKWARIQGSEGAIEWVNGHTAQADAVSLLRPGAPPEVHALAKTRPDDFIEELRHIEAHLGERAARSPLRLERGLETMLLVAAAHRSEERRRRIVIDYGKGFRPEAVQ